jgi:hypothetical protein
LFVRLLNERHLRYHHVILYRVVRSPAHGFALSSGGILIKSHLGPISYDTDPRLGFYFLPNQAPLSWSGNGDEADDDEKFNRMHWLL